MDRVASISTASQYSARRDWTHDACRHLGAQCQHDGFGGSRATPPRSLDRAAAFDTPTAVVGGTTVARWSRVRISSPSCSSSDRCSPRPPWSGGWRGEQTSAAGSAARRVCATRT